MTESTRETPPDAMMDNSLVQSAPRSVPSAMAGATALVQRTLGEVQVAVMMAKQFPRDKIVAQEKLLNDCCRVGLAAVAMYSYSKGGTDITGPSIRLAEAAKTAWGNMQSGWREVSRSIVNGVGVSEVEAFAWDTENNTRQSVLFNVKHWRDKRGGKGYPLNDEREIYELCANQAARRERACILKTIDGDIIEAALNQCNVTLHTKVEATPEKIASMVKMFEAFGVTKAQIEKRVQCRVEAINPAKLIGLGKIHISIKDGMSTPADWFEAEPEEEKPDADKKVTATQKAKDALKKDAPKADEVVDPKTGEVTEKAVATPAPTPAPKVTPAPTPAPTGAIGDTMFSRNKK